MLIVCDIDSTIANCDHRLHHIKTKPKNWKAFMEASSIDTVIYQVYTVLRSLWTNGHVIVLLTGRSEEYRDETVRWLTENDIPYNQLYMRPLKDYRTDSIVKLELADLIEADWNAKIDLVFEDRARVLKDCWQARGTFTFDVSQGRSDD